MVYENDNPHPVAKRLHYSPRAYSNHRFPVGLLRLPATLFNFNFCFLRALYRCIPSRWGRSQIGSRRWGASRRANKSNMIEVAARLSKSPPPHPPPAASTQIRRNEIFERVAPPPGGPFIITVPDVAEVFFGRSWKFSSVFGGQKKSRRAGPYYLTLADRFKVQCALTSPA
jgi:hypothetical protein